MATSQPFWNRSITFSKKSPENFKRLRKIMHKQNARWRKIAGK